MNKPTILIMFGGKSTEHEVSLRSAYSILSNIDTEKYDILMLGVTKDGRWLYFDGDISDIPANKWHESHVTPAMLVPDSGSGLLCIGREQPRYLHIDAVFPVMHGANSEDGTLQGLFEICGLPYVGPNCLSSAVAMDKVFTKLVLDHYGIPQASFLHFSDLDISQNIADCTEKIEKKFSYPVFVKPANAGSSVGTGKARDRGQLCECLVNAARFDSKIIVEEYITAKEIEVAVMGNGKNVTASACGHIDSGADYYDYDAKYTTDTSKCTIPAGIPADIAEKVREYAKTIYIALGCKGLSRVDFFVCEDGRVVFNEINTLPGFTTISMYPKLFIHAGMTYTEIIDKLICLALEK